MGNPSTAAGDRPKVRRERGEIPARHRRAAAPSERLAAVEPDLTTLVIIAGVAVLAPIIADIPRRARIATVVVEILLGIVIGPEVLDIAEPDDVR